MKTLKERQRDRAARIAENAARSEQPSGTGNDRVGNVMAHMTAATGALASLSDEERQELGARMGRGGEPTEGYRDVATFPQAGIGVTNPFVVDFAGGEQSGNGGNVAPSETSPADAFAAAAWGSNPAPAPAADGGDANEGPDEYEGMTVAQLKEVLTKREVTFESDANKARLQELARG